MSLAQQALIEALGFGGELVLRPSLDGYHFGDFQLLRDGRVVDLAVSKTVMKLLRTGQLAVCLASERPASGRKKKAGK
jgi:hypothetical protein